MKSNDGSTKAAPDFQFGGRFGGGFGRHFGNDEASGNNRGRAERVGTVGRGMPGRHSGPEVTLISNTWTLAAVAVVMSMAALGFGSGCGSDGPGFVERHDYSAFLDFNQGDAADPDSYPEDHGTQDAVGADSGRDNGHDSGHDAALDDGPGSDTADTAHDPGQIGNDDGGGPDDNGTGPEDTGNPADPKIVFVTDDQWESRANNMIARAKTKVDVVHLEFPAYSQNDISIASSLKNAAKRNVRVRVMLDDDPDGNAARTDDLNTAGTNMTAKLDTSSKSTHVKLLIIDDAEVLVGSTNLSKSSLHFNHEANVWITDSSSVAYYVQYFTKLWDSDGSQRWEMRATMTAADILPIGDGEYAGAVLPYLNAADTRIWLVMYDYKLDVDDVYSLTDAITGAIGRGVDVRVFLEDSNFADYVDEDNRYSASVLDGAGAKVRFDTEDITTHAKLLIIDDAVAVYSGNWRKSGLQDNHESGAVVEVPSVTTAATTYFNSLWNQGIVYQ